MSFVDTVATITIHDARTPVGYRIINRSDYDPNAHTPFDQPLAGDAPADENASADDAVEDDDVSEDADPVSDTPPAARRRRRKAAKPAADASQV